MHGVVKSFLGKPLARCGIIDLLEISLEGGKATTSKACKFFELKIVAIVFFHDPLQRYCLWLLHKRSEVGYEFGVPWVIGDGEYQFPELQFQQQWIRLLEESEIGDHGIEKRLNRWRYVKRNHRV